MCVQIALCTGSCLRHTLLWLGCLHVEGSQREWQRLEQSSSIQQVTHTCSVGSETGPPLPSAADPPLMICSWLAHCPHLLEHDRKEDELLASAADCLKHSLLCLKVPSLTVQEGKAAVDPSQGSFNHAADQLAVVPRKMLLRLGLGNLCGGGVQCHALGQCQQHKMPCRGNLGRGIAEN